MTNVNMNEVENVARKFEHDELQVTKELKRVQSIKCRLKKQKGRSTYQEEMTKVVQYEQILKEAKQLISPKGKVTTAYTQEDVDILDYDETIKALNSIRSKKTLSKWLTTNEGDNDEYRNACRVEAMLLEHKKEVAPIEDTTIRKSDVQTIIDTIESSGKLSNEQVLELLKKML